MEGCFSIIVVFYRGVSLFFYLCLYSREILQADLFCIVCLIWRDRISLTLLLATSFHIKAKLGRLIILLILLPTSTILVFIFSLLPRITLQRISTRTSFFLCSSTGAWLILAVGIDIWTRTGLLDAMTLLVCKYGVMQGGLQSKVDKEKEDEDAGHGKGEYVVRWDDERCKGLLAGIWLL
jgi:hypothetical protein